MLQNAYKFNIEQKLNQLEYGERNSAQNSLIAELDVTYTTFHAWRKLLVDSPRDIPAIKLAVIAKFFGCAIEELINIDLSQIGQKSTNKSRKGMADKFGMGKAS